MSYTDVTVLSMQKHTTSQCNVRQWDILVSAKTTLPSNFFQDVGKSYNQVNTLISFHRRCIKSLQEGWFY
jgi:hypothetical protein